MRGTVVLVLPVLYYQYHSNLYAVLRESEQCNVCSRAAVDPPSLHADASLHSRGRLGMMRAGPVRDRVRELVGPAEFSRLTAAAPPEGRVFRKPLSRSSATAAEAEIAALVALASPRHCCGLVRIEFSNDIDLNTDNNRDKNNDDDGDTLVVVSALLLSHGGTDLRRPGRPQPASSSPFCTAPEPPAVCPAPLTCPRARESSRQCRHRADASIAGEDPPPWPWL